MDMIEAIFRRDGVLSKTIERFEYRPQQYQMAEQIFKSLNENEQIIIEAPTGTGKTLAYLIPAVISQKRILIATATKNLQEQIFTKDIPLIAKVLGQPIKAALMKGRGNYLCKRRFEALKREPSNLNLFQNERSRQAEVRYVSEWLSKTETGDREELKELPEGSPLWSQVASEADFCTGSGCDQSNSCFVSWVKYRAQRANLIVINHHLFFADLCLRTSLKKQILPDFDGIIFDEAHQIEAIASEFLGVNVNHFKIHRGYREIHSILATDRVIAEPVKLEFKKVLDRWHYLSNEFFQAVGRLVPESRGRFKTADWIDPIRDKYFAFDSAFDGVLSGLLQMEARLEVLPQIISLFSQLRNHLAEIVEMKDDSRIYWYESREGHPNLLATPVELKGILRDSIFKPYQNIVLTSATLSVAGDFTFFKERLGIDKTTSALSLPEVFAYEKQVALYIPKSLPQPSEGNFVAAVATEIAGLLDITQGKALCLFTSYRNLKQVVAQIAEGLPYLYYIQGDSPNSILLREFRDQVDSVLFGTMSFWEGVDVQGRSLSLVIIDKLPFEVPTDPIIEARTELMKKNRQNPFIDFFLPMAVLTLRQGFGRLIRTRSDYGIVAILDRRLWDKSYGKTFLKSLPKCHLVSGLADLRDWWEEIDRESGPKNRPV